MYDVIFVSFMHNTINLLLSIVYGWLSVYTRLSLDLGL